ncbi:hypothetical protein [Nitrosopumilus sp.]|uniref:hypothetical protein n=1 Tax=Nitrosopumilus sp. TaxID=2024843 RepID=UPI0034A0A5FB
MSDEFLKVAAKEINDDLSELEKILTLCHTDADILSNIEKFQKYTHKIKGLAPMMGKEDLGDLAFSLDSIFKKISIDSPVENIFNILSDVIPNLKFVMLEPDYDLTMLKQQISHIQNILNI